jgi:hypothetical protein
MKNFFGLLKVAARKENRWETWTTSGAKATGKARPWSLWKSKAANAPYYKTCDKLSRGGN